MANLTSFGISQRKRVANAVVLAPILPAVFKNGWSIVTRTVIPVVVTVPFGRESTGQVDTGGRTTGFGDLSSEVLGHKLIIGRKRQQYDVSLGPFVGYPSASDDFLGTRRWRLGPEVVLGISAKQFVTILVARNEWSVGKDRGRADVNRLVMDYFLFYNLPKLFYLLYETTVTADWEARSRRPMDASHRDRGGPAPPSSKASPPRDNDEAQWALQRGAHRTETGPGS